MNKCSTYVPNVLGQSLRLAEPHDDADRARLQSTVHRYPADTTGHGIKLGRNPFSSRFHRIVKRQKMYKNNTNLTAGLTRRRGKIWNSKEGKTTATTAKATTDEISISRFFRYKRKDGWHNTRRRRRRQKLTEPNLPGRFHSNHPATDRAIRDTHANGYVRHATLYGTENVNSEKDINANIKARARAVCVSLCLIKSHPCGSPPACGSKWETQHS